MVLAQVLAEMAKGGWGVVSIADYEALRPEPAMEVRALALAQYATRD